MYCDYCGCRIKRDSVYCRKCGRALVDQNGEQVAAHASHKKPRRKKHLLWAALCAIGVIALVVGIFMLVGALSTEEDSGGTDAMELVRNGYLGEYTDITVEQILDNYYGTLYEEEIWESGLNDAGKTIVQVKYYDEGYEKDAVVIQFEMLDADCFKIISFVDPDDPVKEPTDMLAAMNYRYLLAYIAKNRDLVGDEAAESRLLDRLDGICCASVQYGAAADYTGDRDKLRFLEGKMSLEISVAVLLDNYGLLVFSGDIQIETPTEQSPEGTDTIALDTEAAALLEQAEKLATGYDYDAAIEVLDAFSGELADYPQILSARASYTEARENLIEWRDPSAVPNLSFHVLVADPSKAFTDERLGKQYNRNFVTTDEFEKILEQLYENNYVLVGLDDVACSTTDDGTNYAANTIYLPEGKKPIMITETMVNYYGYMVESGGFASKLVIEDGKVLAEMPGKEKPGNYDLVPILNAFIEKHPDFSYRGARAVLAVSGYEGVFGYRTKNGGEEAENAMKVVEALRSDGYIIACYSYADVDYGKASGMEIQADLQKWSAEITPILGNVDVLVYAKATDITDYSGVKYDVLYDAGFRYFIGAGTIASAKVTDEYFHQQRIMVNGTQMVNSSTLYASYFDTWEVLDTDRDVDSLIIVG